MQITAGSALLAFASLSSAQEVTTSGSIFGGLLGILWPLMPLVNSAGLQRSISSKSLLNHADQLVKFSQLSNGTRSYGTAGHNATVAYIKKQLDKTGYYDTVLQTFPYLYSTGTAKVSANGTDYSTGWFTFAPSGNVKAPIVVVNNSGCNTTDFPPTVSGNIALIKRGDCEFGLKTALAGAAGAAGAIIYNNANATYSGGTLSQPSRPDIGPYVPVSSLSGFDGQAIIAMISAGKAVIGALRVDSINEDRYSSNVIATSKYGDKDNLVVSGGHSDSVPAGPGINDNGSGSITLLEIALQLTKYKIKNAVRFAFWTAEELGLVGSEYYVTHLPEAERQKIALYLNFDMVASPNGAYFIYDGDGSAFNLTGPTGSDKIEKLFEDYFVGIKIKSAPTQFSGRSDYGPFLDVDVPSGGLDTGAEGIMTPEEAFWWGGQAGVAYDKCYHQACDGKDNLNIKSWVVNTKGAAHAIATYARSLSGIQRPRPASTERKMPKVAQMSYDERLEKVSGHEILAL